MTLIWLLIYLNSPWLWYTHGWFSQYSGISFPLILFQWYCPSLSLNCTFHGHTVQFFSNNCNNSVNFTCYIFSRPQTHIPFSLPQLSDSTVLCTVTHSIYLFFYHSDSSYPSKIPWLPNHFLANILSFPTLRLTLASSCSLAKITLIKYNSAYSTPTPCNWMWQWTGKRAILTSPTWIMTTIIK